MAEAVHATLCCTPAGASNFVVGEWACGPAVADPELIWVRTFVETFTI